MKLRQFRLYTIGCEKSKGITLLVLVIILITVLSLNSSYAQLIFNQPMANATEEFWSSPDITNKIIRFHVVGNSDSKSDQELKYAIRDAILVKVSPRLAESRSLEESRVLLKSLRPEMENMARSIMQVWGKNEQISSDYGRFQFPTKSYGSLVLPAGEYEAVRILIGKAGGANWWCVLFPPLCFVDIEHSTAIPVDAKPAIPLQKRISTEITTEVTSKEVSKEVPEVKTGKAKKKIRFWFWEKILKLMHNS